MVEAIILSLLSMLPCKRSEFEEKISTLPEDDKKRIKEKLEELIEDNLVIVKDELYVLSPQGEKLFKQFSLRNKKILLEAEEWELHPAGGYIPEIKLWYEPLDEKEFVYNWDGEKGLAQIKEAKGGLYYLEIKGKRFWFKQKPLTEKEFIFNLPDKNFVYDWVNGKRTPLETKKIYNLVKTVLKTFLDLGEEIYYDILTLSVFQSFFLDVQKATWFVLIYGSWGGGKTTCGENLAGMFRHGYVVANPSVAFIGRCLDRLKISPFIDEIDVLESPELLGLVRQSYRKGQKYSRINKEGGMSADTFEVFSIFVMTARGMIEEALMSRALPISTIETQDKKLPLINLVKNSVLQKIYNELFIFWGENSVKFESVNPLELEKLEEMDPSSLRDTLYSQLCSEIKEKHIKQLLQLSGRNIELGFLMARLCNFLDVDIDLKRVFEIVQDTIKEVRESGILGTFRDYLLTLYRRYKNDPDLRNKLGEFMISNKDVFEMFNNYLVTSRRIQVSPREFKAMLLDLGFTGNARKNMLIKLLSEPEAEPISRLTLIFTPRVCRRIALDYKKMIELGKSLKEQKTLENIPEKEKEVGLEEVLE